MLRIKNAVCMCVFPFKILRLCDALNSPGKGKFKGKEIWYANIESFLGYVSLVLTLKAKLLMILTIIFLVLLFSFFFF